MDYDTRPAIPSSPSIMKARSSQPGAVASAPPAGHPQGRWAASLNARLLEFRRQLGVGGEHERLLARHRPEEAGGTVRIRRARNPGVEDLSPERPDLGERRLLL